LLLSALGMKASKDNFWTGTRETSPHLCAAVSVLSGGPVGFADALIATNVAVLLPTMAQSGLLLHASRPATALDFSLMPSSRHPLAGTDARAAHSMIGDHLSYTVLVAGNTTGPIDPTAINPQSDLWPPSAATQQFTTWSSWEGPNMENTPFLLWSVVPVLPNGFTFFGEVGKSIAISPMRFTEITGVSGAGGITVSLVGTAGETVTLCYSTAAAPSTRQVEKVSISASGTATVVLK